MSENQLEDFDEGIADLDALAQVSVPMSPSGISGIKKQKRIRVALTLTDGRTLQGSLGVSAETRLSDYLNTCKDFIVLIDPDKKAHIVNRNYIVEVTEGGR
jgi:hypothetical protein